MVSNEEFLPKFHEFVTVGGWDKASDLDDFNARY
jgi:hypothetical protein